MKLLFVSIFLVTPVFACKMTKDGYMKKLNVYMRTHLGERGIEFQSGEFRSGLFETRGKRKDGQCVFSRFKVTQDGRCQMGSTLVEETTCQ